MNPRSAYEFSDDGLRVHAAIIRQDQDRKEFPEDIARASALTPRRCESAQR
jgi:hypothetical protein